MRAEEGITELMEDRTESTASTRGAVAEAAESPVESPFCRELRSKKYYFLKTMPTEENDIRDGSGHCWCRRTMQVIGPDGEKVGPRHCGADRDCYHSLFEA
jgi:hypothetical protein